MQKKMQQKKKFSSFAQWKEKNQKSLNYSLSLRVCEAALKGLLWVLLTN